MTAAWVELSFLLLLIVLRICIFVDATGLILSIGRKDVEI